MKIIGIEAVNIRNGGGLMHLKTFLEKNSQSNYFDKIVVFTNSATKLKLSHIDGIELVVKKAFDIPYLLYIIYQLFFLKKDLQNHKCDLVFVPGSIFLVNFPSVLMPQNMLPFEKKELERFSFSGRLKLFLIGLAQKYSLSKAKGVIYLSEYAFQKIKIFSPLSKHVIIPHGIDQSLALPKVNSEFNKENPMKLLYVSPLYPYKHHEILIKAVGELINEGLNINYKIVGGGSKYQIKSLKTLINNSKIDYIGEVSPNNVSKYLAEANVFIFGSTCENLPITLLEAMSHGLPVVCSKYGVMPEVLNKNSNFFFDPTNKISIKKSISRAYFKTYLLNLEAIENKKQSVKYNWENNVNSTNNFFKQVYEHIS